PASVAEAAPARDQDRVDPSRPVIDHDHDRRCAGARVDLAVGGFDLELHGASGIAEGGLDEPSTREAVAVLLLLAVVKRRTDVVLLSARRRAVAGRIRGGHLGAKWIVGIGLDRAGRSEVALRVGCGVLRGEWGN